VACGEHDEDFEEVFAVFRSGGDVAAYRAELSGAGEGAKASGHVIG
jgi:hypothetical protein